MQTAPLVWIEGIIGAGKSTLTNALSARMGYAPIHEPVDGNPWLQRYYEAYGRAMEVQSNADHYQAAEVTLGIEDFKHVAFSMQMFMLHTRFALQKLAVGHALTGTGAIIDRGMPGDRVFARMLLNDGLFDPLDFATYTMAYEVMCNDLRPPSLIVFLDVEPSVGLARAKERARGIETGLTLEYMTALHRGYLDMLSEIETGKHVWSRGMDIHRVAWNADHQDIDPIIGAIGRLA